jgi:plastocyanin
MHSAVRRLLIATTVALSLAAAPAVDAATRTVQITRNGFTPREVSIQLGDSVVWRNADSTARQVVADTGTFASPILQPGRTFTFTFRAAGTFRYRDVFRPAQRGTVRVAGPPPSVSAAVSLPIVIYGQQIHVAGAVSNQRAGETVTILARPYPQASFSTLATVLTGANGVFDYVTRPTIFTEYQTRWRSASSVVVRSEVKPKLSIAYNRRSRIFTTTVSADHPFAGRWVYLQRLTRFGQWVSVKRTKLNLQSSKRFRASLPRGVNRVRVFLTVNQAGPGYLSSWSPTWILTRR